MFGREQNDEAMIPTTHRLSEAGLVPRALEYLFAEFEARRKSRRQTTMDKGATTATTTTFTQFRCECSFYEIYKERVYDLLAGPEGDGYYGSDSHLARRRKHQQEEIDRTESHQAGIFGSGAGFGSSASSGHELAGSPEKGKSPLSRGIGSARKNMSSSAGGGWQQGLSVREDLDKGAFVEGLRAVQVGSIEVARNALAKGYRRRHEGKTSMNIDSSRSHAIFCLKVASSSTSTTTVTTSNAPKSPSSDSATKNSMSTRTTERVSRFWMVDLAGSERQGKFGSPAAFRSPKGVERQALMKEAAFINKSLVTLGLVISDLADQGTADKGGPKTRAVSHFRDSKLTFLLKDALCGNSRTVLVGNISPDAANRGETLSTLKFAQRSKMVRIAPRANQINQSSLHRERRVQEETTIDGLRAELDRVKSQLVNFNMYGTPERPRGMRDDGFESEPEPVVSAVAAAAAATADAAPEETSLVEPPSTDPGTDPAIQSEASEEKAKNMDEERKQASNETSATDASSNTARPTEEADEDNTHTTAPTEEALPSPPKSAFPGLQKKTGSLARRVSTRIEQFGASISSSRSQDFEENEDKEADGIDSSVDDGDDNRDNDTRSVDSEYEPISNQVGTMVLEAVSSALQAFRVTNSEERILKAKLKRKLEVQLTTMLKEATATQQERLAARSEEALRREKAKVARILALETEEMVEAERRSTLEQLDDTINQWEAEKATQLQARETELRVRETELQAKDRMLRTITQQLSKVDATLYEQKEKNREITAAILSQRSKGLRAPSAAATARQPASPQREQRKSALMNGTRKIVVGGPSNAAASAAATATAPTTATATAATATAARVNAAALSTARRVQRSPKAGSRGSFLVKQAAGGARGAQGVHRAHQTQAYPLLEFWASPERAKDKGITATVIEEERIRQRKLRQERAVAMHIERHSSSPPEQGAPGVVLDGESRFTAPLSPPTQVFEAIMGKGAVNIVDHRTVDSRSNTGESVEIAWSVPPIQQASPTQAQLKPMQWSAMATDLESVDGTEYSYGEDEGAVMNDTLGTSNGNAAMRARPRRRTSTWTKAAEPAMPLPRQENRPRPAARKSTWTKVAAPRRAEKPRQPAVAGADAVEVLQVDVVSEKGTVARQDEDEYEML